MARLDAKTMAGPYPLHEGEYCGNWHPKFECDRPVKMGDVVDMNKMNSHLMGRDRFISSYKELRRLGVPQSCKAGTSQEMQDQGYFGLYLTEDREPFSWEVSCSTPKSLMEPGFEHRYNCDGVPGISAYDGVPNMWYGVVVLSVIVP